MAEDPFDRLGVAVAGVLRSAFATAQEVREDAAVGTLELHAQLQRAMSDAVAEALDAASVSTDRARVFAAEIEAARLDALQRLEAAARAAEAEVESVRHLVAAERERYAREVDELLTDLREALGQLTREMRYDQHAQIERASMEARGLLRQARMHHRSMAKEVDRMIEAAASEAAALRAAALEDAAAVTERVRAVVDLGDRDPANPEARTARARTAS